MLGDRFERKLHELLFAQIFFETSSILKLRFQSSLENSI